MGRKERRLQEQKELKQSILDAAREIALEEGWRNVTMRKIAEKIEYSHAAIYEYFENKDVLMLELLREGFRLLIHDLQAAQVSTQEPREAIVHMAHAYWNFAWRYPELYRVMNGLDGVPFSVDEAQVEGQKVGELLGVVIKVICQRNGTVVSDAYVDNQVHLLWSMSHGIISLAMVGRIAGGKEKAFSLSEQALHDALQKWGSKSQA